MESVRMAWNCESPPHLHVSVVRPPVRRAAVVGTLVEEDSSAWGRADDLCDREILRSVQPARRLHPAVVGPRDQSQVAGAGLGQVCKHEANPELHERGGTALARQAACAPRPL